MELHLTLLGAPFLRYRGVEHQPPATRSSAMLWYLAYQGGWTERGRLVYLFWPDVMEGTARRRLSRMLIELRKLPYTASLEAEASRLRWQVESDARDFRAAIRDHRWSRAIELYGGELLESFHAPGAPEFENWLEQEREDLHRIWKSAVLTLASAFEEQAHYLQAAEVLERLHRAEVFDETVLRRYLDDLRRSRQQARAVEVSEHFRRRLEREFSAQPETETLLLFEALQQEAGGRASAPTAVQPTSPAPGPKVDPRHNLPAQSTPFLGRDVEKRALAELLAEPDCRLLSIVAPGGMGKTRLALEVARGQLAQFEHGVWFASFVSVPGPEQMIYPIADALGIQFFGYRQPEDQLLDHLADKTLLLVLDNLEHLLAGGRLLAAMLHAAPGIKLLTTSRERLHLQAEQVFALKGLAVPERGDLDAQDFDSGRFFAQRARRSRQDFVLDDASLPMVTRICQLLEGMPLALELAATWLTVLSLDDIAHEIETGIGLLEATTNDLPARHRSIRAVFDHSWGLLGEEGRAALRRLAVFHGGFRREAALAVADVTLPVLADLVDKSFLTLAPDNRYHHHPLVIQYTHEKLADHPEEKASLEERHGLYYLRFLQNPTETLGVLKGSRPRKIQEVIKLDFANVRAAWVWAVRDARVDVLRRSISHILVTTPQELADILTIAIEGLDASDPSHHSAIGFALRKKGLCLSDLGQYEEGRRAIERGLDFLAETDDTEGMVFGLADLAFNSWMMGDYPQSKAIADEGLSLARQHGHVEGTRWVLIELANVVKELDDPPDKERFYREALTEMRQLENRQLAVFLSIYASFLLHAGDLARARAIASEGLSLTRRTEYTGLEPSLLEVLGLVAFALGDHRKAEALLLEALAYPEEDMPVYSRAGLLANLARLAIAAKDEARAEGYLRRSLEIGFHTRSALNMTGTLVPLAALAMARRHDERAAAWLSLSLHHAATQRHARLEARRLLEELGNRMPPAELEAAIDRGRTLVVGDVVEEILATL